MKKSSTKNTRGRIVAAAWKLFYEQGYDDTTIEEIVDESQTSKGSFYHYFSGKDELLSSLSTLFDDKYQELADTMDESMGVIDKLVYINQELFLMIENTVSIELLSQMLSSQLVTSGERHLLDQARTYYKLIRQLAMEGKEKGVFSDALTVNDIVKSYSMFERGLMYDWCIASGNYSLCQYSAQILPRFLKGLTA